MLLNDIIKKKNHFIYSVAHAWDILSSGLVSLFCAFFGGGRGGGEFGQYNVKSTLLCFSHDAGYDLLFPLKTINKSPNPLP